MAARLPNGACWDKRAATECRPYDDTTDYETGEAIMLSTLKPLFALAVLLLLVDTVAACSCFGPRQREGFHPCLTYFNADAVFTGLAAEVSFAPLDANGKPARFAQKVVRFTVQEAFKGVDGPTVEVVTNGNTAGCGYNFIQGQRYFVYAGRRKEDGKLTESLCGPTVPLEHAGRDLTFAREMMKGEDATRIVGAVVKFVRRDIKDHGSRIPMPGIEVTVERRDDSGATPPKTVTDSDGNFEFRGLIPGGYRVKAALPPGSREFSATETPKDHFVGLRPGKCESDSFIITTGSSMKGRLLTHDAAAPLSQHLELVPIDDQGREISSSYTSSVNSQRRTGHYFFRDVPPGRYLLVVNPRNQPGKTDPVYPRMYYPGVLNREQATIIKVNESRELSMNDFMLTAPLKERWFSGVVLMADGTPAVGAKVILIDPNDRMTQTNVTEVEADAEGKFRIRGYETFPYWIDAYLKVVQPNENYLWAPPVSLATSGSVDGVKLTLSLNYRSQPYH